MTKESQLTTEHITTAENHRQGLAVANARNTEPKDKCKAQAGTTKPSSPEHTGRGRYVCCLGINPPPTHNSPPFKKG